MTATAKQETNGSKSKKVIKKVIDVILWIFLVLAVLMTITAFMAQASETGYPHIGDTCFLFIESESMEGPDGFYKGDLITGKVLDDEQKQQLKADDVITFYMDLEPDDDDYEKQLVTHRIKEVNYVDGKAVSFVTKGDANELDDVNMLHCDPVKLDDVQALWSGKRVPAIGGIIGFLQSSTGFLVCIVLPLLAFFIYELVVLILAIIKVKNKDKRVISAEDEEMIKQRAIEEFLAKQNAEKSEQSHDEKSGD